MNFESELIGVAEELFSVAARAEDPDFSDPLDLLVRAATDVGASWSGSWLGYQANVYYENFSAPPPGARFSIEWGLMESWPIHDTIGDWIEYRAADVVGYINDRAGRPDTKAQQEACRRAAELFEELKFKALSILSVASGERKEDQFLDSLISKAKQVKIYDAAVIAHALMPKGQVMSRDMSAAQVGYIVPPHLSVTSKVAAIKRPFDACRELGVIVKRAASYLAIQARKALHVDRQGVNVFIGHGQSTAWRDLKDFISERLRLPWDEFNRVPIAGVTNIARLSQMLDDAAIAFLVMTAEDEQADGTLRARMNVIHEAGLFQGRLGFDRAIILIEQGCEEFTNIQGLGHIRFPAGKITAAFEDVRKVLEREGLLTP